MPPRRPGAILGVVLRALRSAKAALCLAWAGADVSSVKHRLSRTDGGFPDRDRHSRNGRGWYPKRSWLVRTCGCGVGLPTEEPCAAIVTE